MSETEAQGLSAVLVAAPGPQRQPGELPLTKLSLIYLYLPLLLFVWGWLRPPIALLLTVLLSASAWHLRPELDERSPIRRRVWLLAMLLAVAWTSLSGVAGLGHRNLDWRKHDAVLAGLVEQPWPVVYEMEARGLEGRWHGLVFYIAYYLPAGAVGKLLGWTAANLALALWTALGVWLALCWFLRLIDATEGRRRPWVGMLLFVFASGLDGVGILLRGGPMFRPADHLEWWAGSWQYSSNTSLLFWVPHQALGGWLTTALLLGGVVGGRSRRAAPVELAGALLWSPFVFLGALPFALLGAARSFLTVLRSWPNWLLAPAIGVTLALYYAALRQDRLPGSFEGGKIVGDQAGLFLLFAALEFALVLLLCRPRSEPDRGWRTAWLLVGAELLILPFFHFGLHNDLVMRASIPALFALWALAGRTLLDRQAPRWRRGALAFLLLLGFATPCTELNRSLTLYRVGIPDAAAVRDLPLLPSRSGIISQYFGPPDAVFFRWLAAIRPSDQPDASR